MYVKSLENLISDVFFIVDHDSDLKNSVRPLVCETLRLIIFECMIVVPYALEIKKQFLNF